MLGFIGFDVGSLLDCEFGGLNLVCIWTTCISTLGIVCVCGLLYEVVAAWLCAFVNLF